MSGSRRSRQDEAASWFAALRAGVMLVEQRAEFDAWRADPRNQAALDAMHELWGELAILKDRKEPPKPAKPRMRATMFAALAAVVLAAGGAAWLTFGGESAIKTVAGEQKSQALPDGSLIAVNVASQLSYDFGGERRMVHLRDGEAAFVVKPDAERPFIVRSGDYEVQAVGTAFNVRQRDGRLEVAVREGEVEICRASGAVRETLATLAAGQLFRLDAKASGNAPLTPVLESIPLVQVSEWRMRVVTYEDAPLRDVIADFNRYFEQKLLVDQTDLLDRRVTIRLQVENRHDAVETLAALIGASLRKTPEGDMLVR